MTELFSESLPLWNHPLALYCVYMSSCSPSSFENILVVRLGGVGVNASSCDIVDIVKIAVSLFDLHLHCKQWEKGPENKAVHFFFNAAHQVVNGHIENH